MTNVIIIHGTEGSPDGNWFPWLKAELEKLGCQVFVPKFPTPEGQNLDNWLKLFEKYKKYLDGNTILVGHSLGPAFLLSVLEKLNRPVKAAFFVSGFLRLPNNLEVNKTFTDRQFNWDKIRHNCKKFYVLHADNDPHIPLEKSKELAQNLGTDIVLIKGGGHLNKESGYIKFDLLLEKIKNEL
jgi:hypothetical protein